MQATATKLCPHASGSSPWIYNRWLDLIVGCGAWTAPLLLVTYLAGQTSALAWSVAFYALALLFNYPHYMATLYRAYHCEDEFRKYRVFTVHITLLMLGALAVSHYWYRALPWIFTIYLTGSPWHYSGQNYGLFMLFARRAGAKPSGAERQALYLTFLTSYLILFLGFHTGLSGDPLFISLGLTESFSGVARAVLGAAFLCFSAWGLFRVHKQIGVRAMAPMLTIFSTQVLWFLVPAALSAIKGWTVPQSRYSTGVLAVMHSAQYLWITSFYARREASAQSQGRWRPVAYFAVLLAGGIALFVPGPWLASKVFHYDFTASFLIFTALVNIHHFILDGAIWKLRDGRIAALLVNSQAKVSSAAGQARSRLMDGLRWVGGQSRSARVVRVGAMTLLLTWAMVDQVRYYFVLHRENLADLQRAAAMDSFDASLQAQLGSKQLEAGNAAQAVAAWRQALQANPEDPVPRNRLLRFLIEQKRTSEAYELTRAALRYVPQDIDLLINHGILANQMGYPEEAIDSWQRALAMDPAQLQAHLYLATQLEKQGKAEAAIPHYVSFLDKAARSGERPPADQMIPIVLRLAQCQVQLQRVGQARQSYALAEKIAAQTGEKKLESLAAVNHAALEASDNKVDEALRLYQHALRIDASGDAASEAADWYAYGLFLRDRGFPLRLAYACVTRAESLWNQTAKAAEQPTVARARADLRRKLGRESEVIDRNPQPLLEEALALTQQRAFVQSMPTPER
jgi:tetratricopeptide (TPR) repeat protein